MNARQADYAGVLRKRNSSIKCCLSLFALSLVTVSVQAAGAGDVFSARSDGPLQLLWRGEMLISSDNINLLGESGFDKPTGYRAESIHGAAVQNMWIKTDKTHPIPVRREVAIEKNIAEVAIQYEVPAYYSETRSHYTIRIPLSALQGYSYKGYVIDGSRLKAVSGVIPAAPDEKTETLLNRVEFLALEKGDRRIVFDFNPSGLSAFNTYGPVQLVGRWYIRLSGEFLEMYFFSGSVNVGGNMSNSIVRIIDGATFDDFKKHHPYDKYTYFDYVSSIIHMNFGPDRLFGMKVVDSDSSIQTIDDGQAGILHSFAQSSGKATLPLEVPQPGLYVITIRISGPSKVFHIGLDGKEIAKTKPINAGQCQTVTIPFYAKKTHNTLSFDGHWKICSLAVQPLIYQSEDFTFTRRLWRAKDIPTPSTFFCGPLQETNFKADVQTFPWKGSDVAAVLRKKPSLPPASESRIPPDRPDALWRWSAKIGGLGPGNYGSFREFADPKNLSRRLDDLKRKGFNVLLVNGMLYRQVWPDQLDRVQRTMKTITEEAHKRGMKVIDHQSLTLLINADCGMSVINHNINWTQRDLRNGLMTRGWCVNNQDFRKHYFKYIRDYVKNTGIDGLMLDEVAFHEEHFCGCEHCRRKFHEMTGLDMPADETSPVIKKKSNHLWQLWLEFRARSLGDFRVALFNAVKPVNPDFTLINYTTHEGFLGWGFERSGGDMTNVARCAGMLGTEIMSRNVYECYRQVYAGRAITNSLRWTYDIPIFGLVYHINQPIFAYSGWAMNNMHGQSTWFFQETDGAAGYVDWKDNMQTSRALPQSDVAVLFSIPSRKHAGGYSQKGEILGACEILDDLHIQYDVWFSTGLTLEDLKQYAVVIIPSCANMSDADYDVIRKYIEQGGDVLAIYNVGRNSEFGFRRDPWPIGQWLGVDIIGNRTVPGAAWNGVELKGRVFRLHVKDKDTNVIQNLQIKDKQYPALVQRRIGKGNLSYTPVSIGKENVQNPIRNNEKWTWLANPKINSIFASVLQTAMRKPQGFTSDADSRLRMKLWKYKDQPVWMVHVLNCTGASMKPGQILTGDPPENPYPKLKEDVIFHLTPGKVADTGAITAYWTSPDEPGKRTSLQVTRQNDGTITVTIPRNLIKAYGIAYIKAGKPGV